MTTTHRLQQHGQLREVKLPKGANYVQPLEHFERLEQFKPVKSFKPNDLSAFYASLGETSASVC